MTQQDEKHAEHKTELRHPFEAIIGKQVIHILGQPAVLHRIQVRKLWADRFRVNVFIGPDAASATIAHSYFVVTDGQGNIIATTPGITKKY